MIGTLLSRWAIAPVVQRADLKTGAIAHRLICAHAGDAELGELSAESMQMLQQVHS